ncbi:MAG: VanZ family protein [bacterium]|nr:VanZ family protein [bacterium]
MLRYWLPVYLWAGFIFYLSSLSVVPGPSLDIPGLDKAAHLVEYTILAILLARALKNSDSKGLSNNWGSLTIVIAILYGITDETHQYFVPLRESDVYDLLFDSLGAVIGQAGWWLLSWKKRLQ